MKQATIVDCAQLIAQVLHQEQKYGNNEPYMTHVQAVVKEAEYWWESMGESCMWLHWRSESSSMFKHERAEDQGQLYREVLAACYLHDTIEDCNITRENIERAFGPNVAEIVWRVTNEPGRNRAERHKATYPKVREMPLAVYVKLCDRLANVRSGGKLEMYRKEYPEFRAALYQGFFKPMWQELDRLLGFTPEPEPEPPAPQTLQQWMGFGKSTTKLVA